MSEEKAKKAPPEEHVSTVAILHQHSLEPSKREKVVIPIVLLVLGAILIWVGTVVYDHMNRNYTPVGSVAEVVTRAGQPLEQPTGLAGLIKPDDSRYVGFQVRGWQFWAEKGAITQNHYLVVPRLKAGSIEALVKGERGAAALSFHIDLSRTQGNVYYVDEILRGGVETGETDLALGIYPLNVTSRPAISSSGGEGTFRESNQVAYDKTSSFKGMTRFVARGRLQKTQDRFWIQCRGFNVALTGNWSPGLAAFLENTANSPLTEKFSFYLELEETYPWTEDGKPGRRQTSKEIGSASTLGVLVGDLYIENGG